MAKSTKNKEAPKEDVVYQPCRRSGPCSRDGRGFKCGGYHYGCLIGGIGGPHRWHWHKTLAAQKKCPRPIKR